MLSDKKPKKILFLCPYPFDTAPGQRFRYEQYLSFLQSEGFTFEVLSFLDLATNKILYKEGHLKKKISGVAKGFIRRFYHVLKSIGFDYVFIFREASPFGPPIFEWLIAKVLRKKIIYDFDDAIWIPNSSMANQKFEWLKFTQKVGWICRWAYKVSCGNEYLCNYARQFNSSVYLIPTTIDTEYLHNPDVYKQKNDYKEDIVIGWTGTNTTVKYIEPILPVIESLEQKFKFTFCVIADKNPAYQLKSFKYVPWNKESEIEDLLKFDIGIMPLTDDRWAKGKCGFKALQYMALSIPPVVSPVGVNTTIVTNGEDGFICNIREEWEDKLKVLIENSSLRKEMGLKSRKKVVKNYSVLAIRGFFLKLFA